MLNRKNWRNFIVYLILVIIIAVGVYLYYSQASFLEENELVPGEFPKNRKGYVSDEVWYVSSARNILRNIFGLTPRMERPHATIIYTSEDSVYRAWSSASSYNVNVVGGFMVFSKIKALYVNASSMGAIESFARATGAVGIVYGWVLPDYENVDQYMNLEHPPTAKYIIALIMYLVGDRPLFWRIPSIVMGAITILGAFLIVKELTKIPELGLIAAAAVAVDPMTRAMASVALLDVYVAAFTTLAIYLAIKGKLKEAVIVLGLASTFKFTALMASIPLLLIYINKQLKEGFTAIRAIEKTFLYMVIIAIVFLEFQLLVSIPLIIKIGFSPWFKQSIIGAFSWHLTAKCLGPGCPPYSTPWEWFFGINPFYLYLSPSIAAQGFVPAYALCFILMILTIPSMNRDRPARTAWYAIFGTFLGYVIVWLLGSKTQYSFYAVQLTPLIYSYLVVQLYEFIHRENIVSVAISWKKLITAVLNSMLSIVK